MKLRDLTKLSTRMFKARTSRTLLTIFGMGIGIGAILFLVSLGYGLQKVLLERITTSDSLLSLDVTSGKADEPTLDASMLKKIKETEGVAEVSPAYQLNAQIKFQSLTTEAGATITQPSFLRLGGTKISQGQILSDDQPQGVIITSALSKAFNQSPEEMMGEELYFTLLVAQSKTKGKGDLTYEPVALEAGYTVMGILQSEDMGVYIHSSSIQNKVAIPFYSKVKLKCANSDLINPVREKLLAEGLVVSSLSDIVKQANQVFRVIQAILAFFGIIALAVSAIGMFNTMTVTLMERTEEIGIMKSIGASDGDIMLMFIFESTIMGFLGGVSGIMLGLLGGTAFNSVINFIAQRMGGEPVALFYNPLWFITFILVFATLVGMITGIVPARRASSIDPLDALRYK